MLAISYFRRKGCSAFVKPNTCPDLMLKCLKFGPVKVITSVKKFWSLVNTINSVNNVQYLACNQVYSFGKRYLKLTVTNYKKLQTKMSEIYQISYTKFCNFSPICIYLKLFTKWYTCKKICTSNTNWMTGPKVDICALL